MITRLSFVFLLFSLAAPGQAAAQKRYSADRFDVDLVLSHDGSMRVTETVVFRFEGGTFTEVFRQIPARRTDGIRRLSGQIDGQPWPPPVGEGRFRVDRENGVRAIWRFPAVGDTTKAFGLSYTAFGVVERQAESDVFTWFVLPTDHDYPIGRSQVRVGWPAGARPIGDPLVTPAGAEVRPADDGVLITARDLAPDAVFRVTVRFETGSLVTAMPEWQARGVRGAQIAPSAIALSGLILAAGLAWSFIFWNSHRRPSLAAAGRLPVSSPPGDLPPALAGALFGPMSAAMAPGFFGTVLDLARRGVVRIEQSADRTWYRSRSFEVVLGRRPPGLRPHEEAALDLLFVKKGVPRDRIKLSDVLSTARAGWKRFKGAVAGELLSGGMVSRDRKRTRDRVVATGIGILILGALLLIPAVILAQRYGGWPIMVPVAAMLLGVIVAIVGASHSILTDDGLRVASSWKAHARHLKDITRDRAPMPDAATFEQGLAFAVAAGLGGPWMKSFKKSGRLTAVPGWFTAAAAADAVTEIESFAVMMGGVHTAVHSGSHGAGGAASAGGGGASGAH